MHRLLSSLLLFGIYFFSFPPRAEDKPKDPPKEEAKKDPKDMTLDECEAASICPVTRQPSKLIYHVAMGGKEYHFATRDAAKEFQAHPEKYGYKKSDEKKEEPKK